MTPAKRIGRTSHRRRGLGLIEMAITGVLLAGAMVATVQVISWVAHERKAVERRQRALAEASNLMERIAARPWSELNLEQLAKVELSERTLVFLPRSNLNIQLVQHDDEPVRKKIKLEIRWRDHTGRTEAPVRIVTWVYKRGALTQ